jgi:hypothetical protein
MDARHSCTILESSGYRSRCRRCPIPTASILPRCLFSRMVRDRSGASYWTRARLAFCLVALLAEVELPESCDQHIISRSMVLALEGATLHVG